jgi:hypothetical protein
MIVLSAQTLASGLTYDPYEIYYGNYYGVGVDAATARTSPQEEMTSNRPYNKTLIKTHVKVEVITSTVDADMANPMNFYNW